MDAPTEVSFGQLLLAAIGLMLLIGGAVVVLLVTYQKRLLQQQLHLRAAEAGHQEQLLLAVIEAQEVERERIGRDLHDDVGSTVAMARMLVDRLGGTIGGDDAATLLDLAREVLGTAVDEIRSVSHSLYPALLARAGLLKALEYLAEVTRRSGSLAVVLDLHYPHPLGLAQELALYRICQELVHNTIKHARGASQLRIELHQSGPRLSLTVTDNGCGFSPGPAAANGVPAVHAGVGLRSIGVRVDMLRARLEQQSAPNQGTRTRIELDHPLPA
ncbi:sensor histidine kinase [Hymenobacter rubidus]|uniref:sensor histidine kinase n=1 Tax=Hymenobacter rubidus TaxID=1441626 RepID=UPI00191CAE97|nr:ATP-binding protein [Hymenobacter rubidus]